MTIHCVNKQTYRRITTVKFIHITMQSQKCNQVQKYAEKSDTIKCN